MKKTVPEEECAYQAYKLDKGGEQWIRCIKCLRWPGIDKLGVEELTFVIFYSSAKLKKSQFSLRDVANFSFLPIRLIIWFD